MTYKVCVFLNNLKVNVYDDFITAKDYLKSKGYDVSFNFVQTNLSFGVKDYDGTYWGINEQEVKPYLTLLVKPLEYHCSMFLWDKDGQPMRDKLTSWSNYGQLIPDTEFIQLVTASYDDQIGYIWKSIAHEIVHSFFKRIARTGLVLNDPMDLTPVIKDGVFQQIPYYNNDNPTAKEGNFATAFSTLEPYKERIFRNPFNEAIRPVDESNSGSGDLLPVPSKRRSGIKVDPIKYLVAHDTGNKNSTARQNVEFYKKSAFEDEASAHAFVDDKEVIWCIPEDEKAWHVRYSAGLPPNTKGSYANDCALGIELCFFDDQERTKKAYANYCAELGKLCTKYNLNPYTDIYPHENLDPSRRSDPFSAFLTIGKTWTDFTIDVALKTNRDTLSRSKFTKLIDFLKGLINGK